MLGLRFTTTSKSEYLSFLLSSLLTLLLIQPYSGFQFLTSDDFLADPHHLYVRDARWAVIPFLAALDEGFGYQQFTRPLSGLLLSVVIAALATMVSRPWAANGLVRALVSLTAVLALSCAPNLLWAGGMWYSTIAFLGVAISLAGIQQIIRRDGKRWLLYSVIWLLGMVVTFLSYQPFVLLPLIMWAMTGSVATFRRGSPGAWKFYVIPILGSLTTILVSVLLSLLSPSSRLGQALDETGWEGIDLRNLLIAYGRPDQAPLVAAAIVLGVVLARQLAVEKESSPLDTLQVMFVAIGTIVILFLPPLFFEEARQERFALSILISLIVGLLALLFVPQYARTKGLLNLSQVSAEYVLALGAAGLVATSLAFLGQERSSFLVLGALSVWVISLALGVSLGWRELVNQGAMLCVLSLIAVGFAQSRSELQENTLALYLDRKVASEIVWEVSRAPLVTTEQVTVYYEVVGPPQWYSPLLRTAVSGPEVLENYFSALNSIDVEVQVVNQQCGEMRGGGLKTRVISPTEILVCVSTRADSVQ